MLQNLWKTLKALAASRKVMLAVISGLVFGAGRLGWNVSTETMAMIVGPLWAGIFGIAFEDAAAKKAAGQVGAAAVAPAPAPAAVGVNQPGVPS